MFRIGFGTDIHRLVAGRPLVIGGVEIEIVAGQRTRPVGAVVAGRVSRRARGDQWQ